MCQASAPGSKKTNIPQKKHTGVHFPGPACSDGGSGKDWQTQIAGTGRGKIGSPQTQH